LLLGNILRSRRPLATTSVVHPARDTRRTEVTIGYLDPGSGSLIASAVVGGAAAAGVAVRQVRHRLTSKFSRKRADGETPSGDAESGADPATTDA
jgi:hypothetical protein